MGGKNLFGGKMMVVDLVLASLWGLVFSRYCSVGLLSLILMRIALSFQMHRRSLWTLVSAIGFMIAYSCAGNMFKPFEGMIYYFLCAIDGSERTVDYFSHHATGTLRIWIDIISILWYGWLVILPVAVGICLRNLKKIQWRRKWIWIYLVPILGLCLWVMYVEGEVGGVLLGIALALLPFIYWCIYERRGRSVVEILLDDKRIMWYVAYTVYALGVITIGVKDIFTLKFVGLLVLPSLFYVMLIKSMRQGTVLTRCCLALALAGGLYWKMFDAEEWVSIGLLVIALSLTVFVGVTMLVKTRRWGVAILFMMAVPLAIIPGILGLNPYVCLDTDHTRMYIGNPSVRRGVYVVEKYSEVAEKGTPYYWRRNLGLRDRYGLILPAEYSELLGLDYWGRYVVTNRPVGKGCLKSDQRYGIFDLRERRFIVNPDDIQVSQIERLDDAAYKLINPEGKHFATLYLGGYYQGTYHYEPHVEYEP